jgi:1,4-dihydroxy-2-naphthoate octaprenyltransferase
MKQTKVSNFSAWLQAMRLRTLFLSMSCIWAGLFAVQLQQNLSIIISLLTLFTALFLQILSNFANDYGDSIHGADHAGRKGPKRSVQTGTITAKKMKKAMILMATLAFISGCILLAVSANVIGTKGVLVLLSIGILGIAAAIAYTNGKRPYGYMGLGDLAVFIFFGLIAVVGTQYLQTGTITQTTWLLAISFGSISTGVLHLNNMRDIDSDKTAGKMSIAVRLGLMGSKIYYSLLLLVTIACFSIFIIRENFGPFMAFTISLIIMLNLMVAWRVQRQEDFDPLLKYLSISSFIISLNLQLFLSLT